MNNSLLGTNDKKNTFQQYYFGRFIVKKKIVNSMNAHVLYKEHSELF